MHYLHNEWRQREARSLEKQSDFVDYYEILQISPNAHTETVHRVYRLLAQHYHPDNKDTGDVDTFTLVLEAYRILSDPERRAGYDVQHQIALASKWKIFDQTSAVQGIDGEKRKRLGILSLLCTQRINEPDKPSLNLVELETMLGCPREHLELSLWYLRESGRITRSDNGKYILTAKGFEALEENTESMPVNRSRKMIEPARGANAKHGD
jgi:curved DNA-binding protein CbpA